MSQGTSQQLSAVLGFPMKEIASTFSNQYKSVPSRVKVLDIFTLCALSTAILQVVYSVLVGSYPFNAFLAGTFCCLGSAVLTMCLRLQMSEGYVTNKSAERAFVEYALAMSVMFLAVWCYIG